MTGRGELTPGHCSAAQTMDSAVKRLLLTPTEAAEVYNLAQAAEREFQTVDDARFVAEAAVIAHELPRAARRLLVRARADDAGHAAVLSGNRIKWNLLEPTPTHWSTADSPGSRIYAFQLMIFAALLGDAIGWSTQQAGRLVSDVVPTPGQEDSKISASSHTALTWHTEDAYSPSRADHVGLFCLRNPARTPTTVSFLSPGALDPKQLRVLCEPRFLTEPDPSHATATAPPSIEPLPVVSGAAEAPVLRIDRDFTTAVPGDDQAEEALAALVAHLDANLYTLALEPGDICFLNNRSVVHGREPFVPNYDGTDRWLKRVNVVADLRRTRPDRRTSATRVIEGRH